MVRACIAFAPIPSLVLLLALGLAPSAAAADEAGPAWYPPSEPSPFIPDDARWITGGTGKTTHFRGTWRIKSPVKRAVLVTGPKQTVRLFLNGHMLLEAYDSHQAQPAWAEVTDRLQPGDVFVAARVYCEWRPALYVQMRVEYADGSLEDLTTGPDWQWADDPGETWASDPAAPGDWHPVEDAGGYHPEDPGVWGHDFALLPREALRQRFEAHNSRLRESWSRDRDDPGLRLTDPPDRPEWAQQFRDFCRVDETTGQLVDGSGRVRHLFFTIYGQDSALGLDGMDLAQLERDLDLMAQADVHPYMRFLGWGWLLTDTGEWAKLDRQPSGAGDLHFERGVDLLDHFVQRAWAHGRYIIFEGDFFWGAHPIVPAPYRSRYHLYPEVLEAEALATRKIMHRYAGCTNVLGMMIGEEDIVLDHDLSNPHQHALFADFLRRKYGTLEAFKQATPWGYDYSDRSGYREGEWQPEYWPSAPKEKVLVPSFQARRGVFDGVEDWSQIPLPLWPGPVSRQDPGLTLAACRSHNQFTPEDPLWIDFYEMREDELLFGMLVRWAGIVREGMPRQLLFYSNAQDLTSSWHFLHLYRRADLPFDVIGVGCHDDDHALSEIPAWATVRKAIKVISAYRPYVLAPGSPSRGVASGEGCGGHPDRPEEVLDYYRATLFDEIGGGAAWTQTYTWRHVSGAEAGGAPRETPLLQWMSEFLPAVQGVEFPLRRPVQVLIVRNTNLAHSNMSGLDYGNARAVAEALTQLNVEFDIVMDRDLAYGLAGRAPARKTELSPYRLVILPTMGLDLPDSAWQALDAWLHNPAPAGDDGKAHGRVLAVGWIGKRGPRLQPTEAFDPTLQRWLGFPDYPATAPLQGPQRLVLADGKAERTVELDFGRVPPTGLFQQGEAFLRTEDGRAVAARFACGGNWVYAFGFPMGFAHEPLWGLEPAQNPLDAAAPVYEALASAAGLTRPVLAPHNLRVYVAAGGKMILVRERAGLGAEFEIGVRAPETVSYPGVTLTRGEDGYARFRLAMKPWEGRWLKAGQ